MFVDPNKEEKSIKKLLNLLDPKYVAYVFINNDDLDGDNLTYSEIQECIMKNLDSKQLYNLHSYFK